MRIERGQLIAEIERLAPWFQRIEFPDHGVSTTDEPSWMVNDTACDNFFPGMLAADAPRMRPLPKYERFRSYLPDVSGKTVLEVGCSCGFFCFEFARRGASAVTGLDIDPRNIVKATFCAKVLGIQNAQFASGDIGEYGEAHDIVWGASLHEHFFFPFYYLARLLCLAKEKFVLETHHYIENDDRRIATLDFSMAATGRPGTHAFHFSRQLFRDYLRMLWIPESRIEERVFYEDSVVRRLLLFVDTRDFQSQRNSHPFLKVLRGVGQER